MAQDSTKSYGTTFTGSRNHGLQQGYFSGQQTNHFHMTGVASSLPCVPFPPSAIIPFWRDRDFVERHVLEELSQRAVEPGAPVALVGLGGIGKTQVVVEYAYRIQNESPKPWVFWVHASSAGRFEEGYKSIAQRLQLAGWQEPEAYILGIVHNWLSDENNGRWTMVVDNVDDGNVMFKPQNGEIDPEAPAMAFTQRPLADYLPSSRNGSIVIPTRNREVAERLIDYPEDILDLGPMEVDEAVVLLTKKLMKTEGDRLRDDLVDLARQLDCMPLAMSQAAAYVNQRAPRMTLSRYLGVLRGSDDGQSQLLQTAIPDRRRDGQALNSIITTWYLSFDHVRRTRESAARLLSLMCLFDRAGIPDDLLRGRYLEGSSDVPNDVPADQQSEVDFENDITTLRAYSLIGMGTSDQLFEMHRLVQFTTKKWLEVRGELERWQERCVTILDHTFPSVRYETWSLCQTLFPHVQMLMSYPANEEGYRRKRASILCRGAWYALDHGLYGLGEAMAQISLDDGRAVLDRDDSQIWDSMSMLARALSEQGRF